jgi:hypothetical protein
MKCTVQSCNKETQQGDLYFCQLCRINWRLWLGELQYRMLNQADELILLKKYRDGMRVA